MSGGRQWAGGGPPRLVCDHFIDVLSLNQHCTIQLKTIYLYRCSITPHGQLSQISIIGLIIDNEDMVKHQVILTWFGIQQATQPNLEKIFPKKHFFGGARPPGFPMVGSSQVSLKIPCRM